jgi:hypothetical protein
MDIWVESGTKLYVHVLSSLNLTRYILINS